MQERLYNIFYGNGEGRMENKLEEKSYRKNVIKIIIGCILLAIAGIEITVKVLVWKRNWMTNFLDALILLVIVVGVFVLIYGILGLIFVNEEKEYLRNLPYKFDYVTEFELHKNTGIKRKGKKGKSEFTYFNKYSAWKSYIEQMYADRKNNEDFYRFLNRKLRGKKSRKELMLNMMIPLDVTILTVFFTVKTAINGIELVILLVVMILLLANFLTVNILEINKEIYFIEDFMELVFPELYMNSIQNNTNQK